VALGNRLRGEQIVVAHDPDASLVPGGCQPRL
jgi:hypothetical protein